MILSKERNYSLEIRMDRYVYVESYRSRFRDIDSNLIILLKVYLLIVID